MKQTFWAFELAVILLAGMLFSGCATSQLITDMKADPQLKFLDALSKVTADDLDAAMADATAHNDQIAMACYPVLKKFLQSGSLKPGGIKGAFSAFQAARDIGSNVNSGVPTELRLGCAALVQDTRDFMIKMALIAGGAASGAGAVGPLLPAAGAALKATLP